MVEMILKASKKVCELEARISMWLKKLPDNHKHTFIDLSGQRNNAASNTETRGVFYICTDITR